MDVQNFEYTEDSEARYFSPPQGVSSYYANAGDSKTKSLKERMASCYFGDECRGGLDTYQEAMEGKEVIWTDKKVLSDAGEILVVKAYLKEHIYFLFHYQDKNFDALTEKLLTSFSQKKHYRSSPGNEIFTYREYI